MPLSFLLQVAVISNEGKLFVIQLPELSRDFSHTKDLKLFGAGQVILDGTCIQRSGTAITRSCEFSSKEFLTLFDGACSA